LFFINIFCQQPGPVFLLDLKTDSSDYYIEIFEFKAPRIILPNRRPVYIFTRQQTDGHSGSEPRRQAGSQTKREKKTW
jgi:hypothetical protein